MNTKTIERAKEFSLDLEILKSLENLEPGEVIFELKCNHNKSPIAIIQYLMCLFNWPLVVASIAYQNYVGDKILKRNERKKKLEKLKDI